MENPGPEAGEAEGGDGMAGQGGSRRGLRRKALVYVPTEEVIGSYGELEEKLRWVGWERYHEDPELLQFHKRSTVHLISLPKDFSKFRSTHMYDIVVKNRHVFEVRDLY